ncbi:MAG TPA: peptidylprolyl isomerase [bacterium]|nr:peptidylprolyl isomerase [bacterium]HPS29502.1 peptidylprolyl isomerase [bacterium]
MAVKTGDKIAVHYTGWLENGEKFDTSLDSGETFKFQVGEGMVIKGFDDAVVGMEIGDKKKITIAPEEAYGPKSEQHIFDVDKSMFPEGAQIVKGSVFEMHSDHGDVIPVTIIDVREKEVILDANHPLAGQTLTFEIELMETGVELPDYSHHHGGCCCGGGECEDEECEDEKEEDGCSCGCNCKK